MEDELKLQKDLAEFIVHRSWECTDGKFSEALVLDGIQRAKKYLGIQLSRKYEYQQPSE